MRLHNPWRSVVFGAVVVVLVGASPLMAEEKKTDKEIRQILIKESIDSYSGQCPCPYSLMKSGRRCGSRSAYSKPGGAEPLCYEKDVTDDMVKAYRKRTEKSAKKQALRGQVEVLDGDTLRFAEPKERVRLLGIDAPELGQLCANSTGEKYDCGENTTRALVTKIQGRPVQCEGNERGTYGRLLAVCYTEHGEDLNGWMVVRGNAVAYRQYSSRYVSHEEEAKRAKRGLWNGEFDMPWDWRKGKEE